MASSKRSFYGATAGRDRWWLLHFVRSQWFRRGHQRCMAKCKCHVDKHTFWNPDTLPI